MPAASQRRDQGDQSNPGLPSQIVPDTFLQAMLQETLNRAVDLKPRSRPALPKGDGGN